MRLLAPAKINLHLRVGAARGDGFHPLCTWMCTVGLFDTLTLTRQPAHHPRVTPREPFTLVSNDPRLPNDERNLVVRAANALADTLHRDGEGRGPGRERVSAILEKHVPMGAGLGGGSSDAAATLRGLARLWKIDRSDEQLARFSAQLGSDVPFFFHQPSAVCTGQGEIVRPVAPPAPRSALLVLPALQLSTAEVYARFDEMKLARRDALDEEPDWRTWSSFPASDLLPRLINDLEPAAFALRPELSALRSAVEHQLARPVRMSGSGSALFTLFDEQREADRAADVVRQRHNAAALAVELAPTWSDDVNAAAPQQ